MNLTKPSVEAALKAAIKRNDKGFTVRDMHKVWGYQDLSSSQRRINKLVCEGIYEYAGIYCYPDVMGRNSYCALYRVVKKKKA